ncbi:hypothetical protein BDD12DRAFT_253254 [Trichophaea hybrida]|nr:hypothetical protein BDD12DRAFT_253254 [Trichophaea hybrida]
MDASPIEHPPAVPMDTTPVEDPPPPPIDTSRTEDTPAEPMDTTPAEHPPAPPMETSPTSDPPAPISTTSTSPAQPSPYSSDYETDTDAEPEEFYITLDLTIPAPALAGPSTNPYTNVASTAPKKSTHILGASRGQQPRLRPLPKWARNTAGGPAARKDRIQILGLDSEQVLVNFQNRIWAGEWTRAVGSEVYISAAPGPAPEEEEEEGEEDGVGGKDVPRISGGGYYYSEKDGSLASAFEGEEWESYSEDGDAEDEGDEEPAAVPMLQSMSQGGYFTPGWNKRVVETSVEKGGTQAAETSEKQGETQAVETSGKEGGMQAAETSGERGETQAAETSGKQGETQAWREGRDSGR